jgi:hypothetical protein
MRDSENRKQRCRDLLPNPTLNLTNGSLPLAGRSFAG